MTNSTASVNHALWIRVLMVLGICYSTMASAHDGHMNDKPWRACEEQRLSDSCAYSNSSNDVYRGTCRAVRTDLICVRNQPIEKGENKRADAETVHEHTVTNEDAIASDTG